LKHLSSKKRQSEKTISRIQEVAIRFFANKGYHGTSLSDITKAANITKGALYGHFDSKKDLFLSLLSQYRLDFLNPLIEATNATPGHALDKLNGLLRFTSDFLDKNPEQLRMVIIVSADLLKAEREIEEELQNLYSDYSRLLRHLVEDGQRQGIFSLELDTDALVNAIIAFQEGSVLHSQRCQDPMDLRNYLQTCWDVMLEGFQSHGKLHDRTSSRFARRSVPSPRKKKKARGTFTLGCPTLGDDSFDPALDLSGQQLKYYSTLIYDGLMARNGENRLITGLAESYTVSEDNRALTFSLRKGVRFHNGMELTAEDVKFSIERALRPDIFLASVRVAEVTSVLVGVDIIDKYTLRFNLKRPSARLLERLSDYLLILPKAIYEQNEELLKTTGLGTGPFKLVRRQPSQSLTLEANEDYWNKSRAPSINTLIMKVIPNPGARWAALKSGEIDFAEFTGTPFVREAENEPRMKVFNCKSSEVIFFAPVGHTSEDPSTKPLTDVRVRKALTLAINRQSIVDTVFSRQGTVTPTIRFPNARGYKADRKPLPYDKGMAQQLLAEAGYPDGFDTEIHYCSTIVPPALAEVIQRMLQEVGVAAKLVNYEVSPFYRDLLIAKTMRGMTLVSYSTLNDTQIWGNYRLIATRTLNAPKAEVLMIEAEASFDEEVWDDKAAQIEETYWQEQYCIPIGAMGVITVAGPRVKEWKSYPKAAGIMSPVMDYSDLRLE